MALVKICGIRRNEDIEYVNACLPDYIGFVFANSKRQISILEAERLKKNLNKSIKTVGVFVNEDIDIIIDACNKNIIDVIQLHGDEDISYIQTLRARVNNEIIKSVSVSDSLSVPDLPVDYFLFDTYDKKQRGGTGNHFNWDIVKDYEKNYFLAGGINIDNIEECITFLDPYCIDISSGVETDGYKDFDKISNIMKLLRSMRK